MNGWVNMGRRHRVERIVSRRSGSTRSVRSGFASYGTFDSTWHVSRTAACCDRVPDADDDIRAGRVKSSASVDEMLETLKRSW